MKKRLVSWLLVFVLLAGLLPAGAFAAGEDEGAPTSVTVDFTASAEGAYLCAPQFSADVSSDLAESYGFSDSVSSGVSALDVLVKAHEVIFGENFTTESVETYLAVSNSGWVTTVFEKETSDFSFTVNHAMPHNGVLVEDAYAPGGQSYTGYTIGQAAVQNGDVLEFFLYQDNTLYLDNYPVFQNGSDNIRAISGMTGDSQTLTVRGYNICYYGCVPMEALESANQVTAVENAQLAWVDTETGLLTDIQRAVTNENGEVQFTLPSPAGTYYLTAYMPSEQIEKYYAFPLILSLLPVTVLPDACITVPENATLFVGSKVRHFVPFTEIEPVYQQSNGNGTVSYYFDLANGTYNYRVSGEGYVTYAGKFTKTAAEYSQTVSEEDLKPDNKTASTIERAVTANSGYNVADIYLNINAQGYLKLDEGDTYQLINLRNWEATDTVTNNYFIEPDYHYTVLNENGSASDSVVTVSDSGLVTAVGEGTAIVLVTYDAINVTSAVGGPFFGAIWPENTGVFVVSVGAGDSGIDTGMTLNAGKNSTDAKLSGDAIDAEHDVIYFTGDKGSYTFTPGTAGVAVSVANPTVTETAMTFSGFQPVSAGADGSYTIPLTQGRNIVKLTRDGKAEYQVITAKRVSYTVNNGQPVNPGDTVSIVFDTLYHPANKLAGVYNMRAYMQYSMQDGKTVNGGTAQYNFAASSNAQTLKVTIPEDYQESTYTLSLGSLCVTGFGDPYGGHRSITLENGKDPNFNASIREAYLGQLPDITIPVTLDKTVTSIEIATPPTKTAYYEGDSFDPSGMVIAATYSDGSKNENVTSYTVSPAALTADTKEVTVTYGGQTATVPVTVTPLEVTDIEVTTPPTKTSYTAGDVFDPTGMVVTATYNNGSKAPIQDYSYEPQRALETGDTAITVRYGTAITATTPITVTAATSTTPVDTITVTFTLLGDSDHGTPTEATGTHTYSAGNLETWIRQTNVTVPSGAKVVDVVARALGLAGIPYENPTGNYITSIRGLAEFSNGPLSGWMYILNGTHPDLGVAEQTVKNGDVIVFHYTDDYTKEEGSEDWGTPGEGGTVEQPGTDPEQPGTGTLPFTDVSEGQWFYEAVRYVYDAELMNGVSETAFAPDDTLSRGMVATVLHRLAGAPAGAGESAAFPDVASGAWFAQGVAWAAAEQIVTGYDDGNFYPDGDITREELAVMLWRYAKAEGMDTDTAGDLSAFSDASAVSAWAAEALAWCVEAGILTGRDTGELDPGGTATRAEAAAILMRFAQM